MLGPCRQNFDIMNMQQAIELHEDYECFIIDEADACITDRGVLASEGREKVLGFWNIMMKKSFLMTATIGRFMEDILLKLFGMKLNEHWNYRSIISKVSASCCVAQPQYQVARTEETYWQMIKDSIKA